eukprot:8636-Heterocapsa_arctica.AAC.1
MGEEGCAEPPVAEGSNVGSPAPPIPDPAGKGPHEVDRPWSVPVSREVPSPSSRSSASAWSSASS